MTSSAKQIYKYLPKKPDKWKAMRAFYEHEWPNESALRRPGCFNSSRPHFFPSILTKRKGEAPEEDGSDAKKLRVV